MPHVSQADAVREGVYDAFVAMLSATGGYPITRDEILLAIREGVTLAVAEHLAINGLQQPET